MQEPSQTLHLRTLKTSALVTPLIFLALYGTNHTNWAFGFLIGAFLSVFSMFTLAVVIPMLIMPRAPRYVISLMQLTLIMKLPVYALALYFATNLKGVSPEWAAIGIGLVPAVITVKALIPERVKSAHRAALEQRQARRRAAQQATTTLVSE